MKSFFTLLLLLCLSTTASAALSAPPALPATTESSVLTLDRKAIEARLGRKLKFTERIVLGVAKRKARRQARAAERSGPTDALALVSFGLGILTILATFLGAGIFVLFGLGAIVTGVIALINLEGKNDYKKGKGFAIAGIAIPVGWVVLIGLLILAISASFR